MSINAPRASDRDIAQVRASLDQATALREVRDFQRAIHVLVRALSHGIETERIYFSLGNVHFDNSDLEQAEHAYKRALGIDPDFANAMHNLAVVYRHQGKYSLYVRTAKRAQRLSSRRRSENARSNGRTHSHRLRLSTGGWLLGAIVAVAILVWLLTH